MLGDLYDEIIEKLNPKLFLIDLSNIYYSVFLRKRNINFLVLSTKVSLDKGKNIPPFTSGFVPSDNSSISIIIVEILWILWFLNKIFLNIKYHFNPHYVSHYFLIKKYLNRYNKNLRSKINNKRVTHFSWKDIPELLLSPRHFDFNRKFSENQIHIGHSVDLKRKEFNDNNEIFWKSLAGQVDIKDQRLIYCSFGSYHNIYYKRRIFFFQKLINYFINKPKYFVVISVGDDINPKILNFNSSNIKLFRSTPQLYLLSKSFIMINHGGLQSIVECILNSVPMLIYPLNNKNSDHNGNAARASFHRIASIGHITYGDIKLGHHIDKFINNYKFYKDNIIKLKNTLDESKDFSQGIKYINNYIS